MTVRAMGWEDGGVRGERGMGAVVAGSTRFSTTALNAHHVVRELATASRVHAVRRARGLGHL